MNSYITLYINTLTLRLLLAEDIAAPVHYAAHNSRLVSASSTYRAKVRYNIQTPKLQCRGNL